MDYHIALPILFSSGIFVGFFAASVGGGALVSFPIFLLTGLPVHTAVASNRFAALLQTSSSSLKFLQAGKTDLKNSMKFAAFACAGSVIGAQLTLSINEKHLNLAAAIMMALVTVFTIIKRNLGTKSRLIKRKPTPLLYLATFTLGIYGGFFGAGFGTILTFVFLYQGYNFIESAANSRTVGFSISVVSTIVFAFAGLINYAYALPMGIGQAIGGWLGASSSIKRGNEFIRNLFLTVAIITSIKLIFDSVA